MSPKWARSLLSVLTTSLVSMLGAACGGNVPSRTAVPPTLVISTTPRPIRTTDDTLLRRALLTEAELGSGWERLPSGSATVADQYFCGRKLPGPTIDAYASFASPPEVGRSVYQTISQFDSLEEAEAVFQRSYDARDGCADWFSTDGVHRTDWHIEFHREANIGDLSFVEKDVGEISGVRVTAMMVLLVHRNAVLSVVVLAATDPGVDLVLDIASKAASRYAAAVSP